jgi:hypothetical protein
MNYEGMIKLQEENKHTNDSEHGFCGIGAVSIGGHTLIHPSVFWEDLGHRQLGTAVLERDLVIRGVPDNETLPVPLHNRLWSFVFYLNF